MEGRPNATDEIAQCPIADTWELGWRHFMGSAEFMYHRRNKVKYGGLAFALKMTLRELDL